MKIYKINNDYENFYSFSIDNGELFSKMPAFSARFKARSRQADWVAPNAEFFQSEHYRSNGIHIPDITTWLLGNLVLNQRAYDGLQKPLHRLGEFLESRCEGNPYYIFNTLQVLPDEYVDDQNTRAAETSGVYLGLESLAFHDFDPSEFPLFKTTADNLAYSYCTADFAELIDHEGFEGLNLSEDLTSY